VSDPEEVKLRKACRVYLVPGENRAWNIELDSKTPECVDALKEIKGNLGSESKKFLSVRLTGDPELKKVFDSE